MHISVTSTLSIVTTKPRHTAAILVTMKSKDSGSILSKIPALHLVRQFTTSPKTFALSSVVFIAAIAIFTVRHDNSGASGDPTNNTAKPKYQTVLPAGKSINQLGGWRRVSPPGAEPVFAYTDSIKNIKISISEQKLPASFDSDTDNRVGELAKNYNATNKIKADSTTVYIGTSAKGPQSVIFTKKGLLVLIKSANKISESDWSEYISSLNIASEENMPKF